MYSLLNKSNRNELRMKLKKKQNKIKMDVVVNNLHVRNKEESFKFSRDAIIIS